MTLNVLAGGWAVLGMLAGAPAEPSVSAQPDASAPIAPTTRRRVVRGLHVGGGVGYIGCARFWCDGSDGLAGLDLSLGYRWGRIEPVATLDLGAGTFRRGLLSDQLGLEVSHARLRTLAAGAGVFLFPRVTIRGVADPYFDVGVGFSGV